MGQFLLLFKVYRKLLSSISLSICSTIFSHFVMVSSIEYTYLDCTEPDLYTRYIFRSVCRTQSVLLRLYICTDILYFIHEQYKGCQISHKIGTVFSSPTDRNSGKYLYHSTLWGVSVPTVLPGNRSTALLPVHGGAPARSDGV